MRYERNFSRHVKYIASIISLSFAFVVCQAGVTRAQNEPGLQLTGPAADIEVFLDDFFTRFSKHSEKRRASTEDRAMIPLLRHTKSNYETSPAAGKKNLPFDPTIGIISKLWIHGPKSWRITEMQVIGDTAFAKVFFESVKSGRSDPIPFGFQFMKMGERWKIAGYLDLRSVPDDGANWHNLMVVEEVNSPEVMFTTYMDQIERYYAPNKAQESMKITPQVEENLSPLWLATEEASKSSSRAIMTFSQLQPRNWQFVSSDFVNENAELIIKASAGNPTMRRNLGMAAMMGSGLKFTLEKVEDEWLLKEYSRSRRP